MAISVVSRVRKQYVIKRRRVKETLLVATVSHFICTAIERFGLMRSTSSQTLNQSNHESRWTNESPFSVLTRSERNYLGRNIWIDAPNQRLSDPDMEIDELRIWKFSRSATEIKEGMFRAMRGDENGLVCLLNFDDGQANDAGPQRDYRSRCWGMRGLVLHSCQHAPPSCEK
jgi:hypothetical protein